MQSLEYYTLIQVRPPKYPIKRDSPAPEIDDVVFPMYNLQIKSPNSLTTRIAFLERELESTRKRHESQMNLQRQKIADLRKTLAQEKAERAVRIFELEQELARISRLKQARSKHQPCYP
jgi:septal ring factor EnvC (AmiA/AmiB activator)